MSKRRKIERPEELRVGPLPGIAQYEKAAEEHRDQVLSSAHVQASFPERPRRRDQDRAAYREGSTAHGRRQLGVISAEERYTVAMEFLPRKPVLDVIRVRNEVVEAVMRIPFLSLALDVDLLSRANSIGIWRYKSTGSFNWRTDLTEAVIEEFAATTLTGMAPGTVNTYRSQLMRVMRGDAVPMKSGRKTKAVASFSQTQWEELWRGASQAGQWSDDVMTLLALSGGAGLRPNEINYIQGSWVRRWQRGIYIRVPNDKGEFRDVPVSGRYAEVICRAASSGPHAYLVMPHFASRKNLVSHLKEMVKPLRSDFVNYDTIRARNRWISRMLTTGVPMVVVAQVAGVGGGSSLLADLAADLPKPDLDQTFNYLTLPELTD